ncbi:hypothetical protein, partial [Klebsiella pneumoniae]
FLAVPREGTTRFGLSTDRDAIQLAPVDVEVTVVKITVTAMLFAIAAVSAVWSYRARRTPLWLITIFAILFMVGFLTWAAA